jgi:hypothetical protein
MEDKMAKRRECVIGWTGGISITGEHIGIEEFFAHAEECALTPWSFALDDYIRHGEKETLVNLFKSGEAPPAGDDCRAIGELLDRHLKRGRGRPRSKGLSPINAKLLEADRKMQTLIDKGMSVSDAADACATSELSAYRLERMHGGHERNYNRAMGKKPLRNGLMKGSNR